MEVPEQQVVLLQMVIQESGSFDPLASICSTGDFQGSPDHQHQTGRRKEYRGSNIEACVPGPEVAGISTTHIPLAKAQYMAVQL